MTKVNNSPKYVRIIEDQVKEKLKIVKKPTCELLETRQFYFDKLLEIYQTAFESLIGCSITYSCILNEIKNAYNDAISIRDERITQFIIQDKIFGVSLKKKERDDKMEKLLKENEALKTENVNLGLELTKMMKSMAELKDNSFSEYLALMRERDARYTLYHENLELQKTLKELEGCPPSQEYGDPIVLGIALERCRDQLSSCQRKLKEMMEEYAETVPRREHDQLTNQHYEVTRKLDMLQSEFQALQDAFKRTVASKKSVEEELEEVRDRCRELERAGTPRPHWDLCADFISGGRNRWWQLARGRSSRDTLRVLLKELGPAAESDHLEYFDGLGTDPAIPPYLRYEGKVRNLRLSRREISVIINDIWLGKAERGRDVSMQDYVTRYFEDRYQQPSVRAEWAYNLCAGAEQLLDEPQVKLFWGVLHGHLSEHIYWGHRAQWLALKELAYRQSKDRETLTTDEFEKVAKATFPLKNEVDIKNLMDVVKKQLKLKINVNEINLEKLFQENEEGFERAELARELYRQRQAAQDKYIREVVAELGGRRVPDAPITVDALKRAFAIVDPAIDHIRMERHIRWTFNSPAAVNEPTTQTLPLRAVAARLAAGDVERAGPRVRARLAHRRHYRAVSYK